PRPAEPRTGGDDAAGTTDDPASLGSGERRNPDRDPRPRGCEHPEGGRRRPDRLGVRASAIAAPDTGRARGRPIAPRRETDPRERRGPAVGSGHAARVSARAVSPKGT